MLFNLHMNILTVTCCFVVLFRNCFAHFLQTQPVHEFFGQRSSYFGFSLAYQAKNGLIVGAPHMDREGGVFACPLGDGSKAKSRPCDEIIRDKQKIFGDYKTNSLNPHFCLGASIAVTPESIFTCAPLHTLKPSLAGFDTFGAYGTCLVHNETNTYISSGHQTSRSGKNLNGTGWSSFIDQYKGVILVAERPVFTSIAHGSVSRPLDGISSIGFHDTSINSFVNKGLAFTSGVFFKGYENEIVYAFSMERENRQGGVAFLVLKENNEIKLFKNAGRTVFIKHNKNIGSMFGAALHAAYLNTDGYSELVVGAPAFTTPGGGYEAGAVFIYLGGVGIQRSGVISKYQLCITNKKEGSHFGAAIASSDLDGDSLPEIFVGAPYEDTETGAVYIISGFEINKWLKKSVNSLVYVTDMQFTQRAVAAGHKAFGFSLQPVIDLNHNGIDVLAVGAPFSNKVFVYRNIPAINVTISAKLKGAESVSEQEMNFTVTVTVLVSFPKKFRNITGELSVTTGVSGDAAEVREGTFNIKLSPNNSSFARDVFVVLAAEGSGFYKFIARVDIYNETLKQTDSENALLKMSQYSVNETTLDVRRHCRGKDCIPILSMSYQWYGRTTMEKYHLGSSTSERLRIIVRNDGNDTYESCAAIRVAGAQVAVLECEQPDSIWYECRFNEIKRNDSVYKEIKFNMSKCTNLDKGLDVHIVLYNNCASRNGTKIETTINVPYVLQPSDININGSPFNRNVTEREITRATLDVPETYAIINQGNVRWKRLRVLLLMEKEPYIKNYSVTISESGDCIEVLGEEHWTYNCTLNLDPHSSVTVLTQIDILKDKIEKNLKDMSMQLSSLLTLQLTPTSEIKNFSLETTVYYKKELSYGQNKTFMLIAAVLMALVVVAVTGYVLYKVGFFKNEDKTKLIALKGEIRKQSMRRPDGYDSTASTSLCGRTRNDFEMKTLTKDY